MSLARRAFFVAHRTSRLASVQTRAASSSSHGNHEDSHHEHDSTEYPAEGFATPFWRNVVITGAAIVAAYKYAPTPDENVYLTRWIALYTTSRDKWLVMNAQHTELQLEAAESGHLLNDAKKPQVVRYRYPQALSHGSPFLNAVGTGVDMENVHIKGPKDA